MQGMGGGGLAAVTLAMVAEGGRPTHAGTPLGVIGAVQEVGSVVGPVYGAVVVTLASWRAIFWINVPLAAALLLAYRFLGRGPTRDAALSTPGSRLGSAPFGRSASLRSRRRARRGSRGRIPGSSEQYGSERQVRKLVRALLGRPVGGLHHAGGPRRRGTDRSWRARRIVPRLTQGVGAHGYMSRRDRVGTHRPEWALASARSPWRLDAGRRPRVRGHPFLECRPEPSLVASTAPVLVPVALVLTAGFWPREATARQPLIPIGALSRRPAWGALVVNLFVG